MNIRKAMTKFLRKSSHFKGSFEKKVSFSNAFDRVLAISYKRFLINYTKFMYRF